MLMWSLPVAGRSLRASGSATSRQMKRLCWRASGAVGSFGKARGNAMQSVLIARFLAHAAFSRGGQIGLSCCSTYTTGRGAVRLAEWSARGSAARAFRPASPRTARAWRAHLNGVHLNRLRGLGVPAFPAADPSRPWEHSGVTSVARRAASAGRRYDDPPRRHGGSPPATQPAMFDY